MLPIVGVNLAYWLASSSGHVPACFVYVDGCTSVSSAGRQFPENLVFRGSVLPATVLIAVYGFLTRQWLQLHGDKTIAGQLLPWFWLLAALFLLTYTLALGKIADWHAMQRRVGVVSYMSLSFLCHLLLTWRIDALRRAGKMRLPGWLFGSLLTVAGLMLAIGLIYIPTITLFVDTTRVERILEWNFCMLIFVFYILTGLAWRLHRFAPGYLLRH